MLHRRQVQICRDRLRRIRIGVDSEVLVHVARACRDEGAGEHCEVSNSHSYLLIEGSQRRSRALESKPEAEVVSTWRGEVAPIDANRARTADGGIVTVGHRIESRVVGTEEWIRRRHEHAGTLEKARRNLVR